MKIIRAKNYDDMSNKAAMMVASVVALKSNAILGLATGSTPLGMYKKLIDKYKGGDISFEHISTVNLDEYAGLAPDNEHSYSFFMDHNFFDHIDINKNRTFIPNGLGAEDEEPKRYEQLLRDIGAPDIQVLGLGIDGHIGFNEPADHFSLETHLVDLDPSTIEANKRFFKSADDVPKKAFTMGIGSIMRAERILLIVSGTLKAEPLARLINGPVSPAFPAGILHFHKDVTIIADEEALSGI